MSDNEVIKEVTEAFNQNLGAGCYVGDLLGIINRLTAKIEKLNIDLDDQVLTNNRLLVQLKDQIKTSEFEACKKFANRLKEMKCHYSETENTFDFDGVTIEDIDDVLEDMIEEIK